MMNIACLANTMQCVLYKIMNEQQDIDLFEYTWFRNATILALVLVLLYLQERNPIEQARAMTRAQ